MEKRCRTAAPLSDWLRGVDLNHRPLGYEPNELPGCSTPQHHVSKREKQGQTRTGCAVATIRERSCFGPALFKSVSPRRSSQRGPECGLRADALPQQHL